MMGRYILQVYLDDSDKEFIQAYAQEKGLTLSQAILDMAEFYDKRNAWYTGQGRCANTIQGISFSNTPLDDYREY